MAHSFSTALKVSSDATRLASQQGRVITSVYSHRPRCPHWGQPSCSNTPNFQAIQRSHGYVINLAFHTFLRCLESPPVQLLHKLSIRGVNGPEKLLKVIKVRPLFLSNRRTSRLITTIKNPVVEHLPPNTTKISNVSPLTYFIFICIHQLCKPFPVTHQHNDCRDIFLPSLQRITLPFSSAPWPEEGTTLRMPM